MAGIASFDGAAGSSATSGIGSLRHCLVIGLALGLVLEVVLRGGLHGAGVEAGFEAGIGARRPVRA